MARSRLRIYYGPEEESAVGQSAAATEPRPRTGSVRLSLAEIFPLLAEAVRSERTWLRDFEHDEITVSSDLYEVILAYQHCRRPSA